MVQPDVEIDDGTGRIIISSEEGETEEKTEQNVTGEKNRTNQRKFSFFYEDKTRYNRTGKEQDYAG